MQKRLAEYSERQVWWVEQEIAQFMELEFKAPLRFKMLGLAGLFSLLNPYCVGPYLTAGRRERELVFKFREGTGSIPHNALAIRPRYRGTRARLTFTCSRDHGFSIEQMEKTLGAEAKIEPASEGAYMVRLTVDESFDPLTAAFFDFLSTVTATQKSLVAEKC